MIPFVALASVAGTCQPQIATGVSSDFRVDLAGERDQIDSHSTSMCVAPDGTTYVVWVDDRFSEQNGGVSDVFLNRKLPDGDRSEGWLPDAVQVNQRQQGGGDVFNPDVACGPDGLVYVVWEDTRDGEVESHQIYFQVSTDRGQTWSAISHLEGAGQGDRLLETDIDGRSNSFNPKIVQADPNVYVVWSDNKDGAFDILLAKSNNRGVDWNPPVRVDSDEPAGGAWSAFPEIVLGGPSTAYVVWEDFRADQGAIANGSDVYFSKSEDGGNNFSNDIRLDSSDGIAQNNSFVPKIAANGANVFVAWHDDRNGENNDVYVNASYDGGLSWTGDQRADGTTAGGASQSLYPSVCMSGPVGHVAYHDGRENGFFRIFYNRFENGNFVGPEFKLDDHKVDAQPGSEDVVLSCAGDFVAAAWLDSVADIEQLGFNDIHYDYSEDGGATWTENPNLRVDSIGEGTAFKTDLNFEITAEGTIRAAWTDGRNGSTDVYFQTFEAGTEADELLVVATEGESAE
jgi:hypothetical protein